MYQCQQQGVNHFMSCSVMTYDCLPIFFSVELSFLCRLATRHKILPCAGWLQCVSSNSFFLRSSLPLSSSSPLCRVFTLIFLKQTMFTRKIQCKSKGRDKLYIQSVFVSMVQWLRAGTVRLFCYEGRQEHRHVMIAMLFIVVVVVVVVYPLNPVSVCLYDAVVESRND